MKALVGAFKQEKALLRGYKTSRNLREDSLEALVSLSLLVRLCITLDSALFRHTIPEEENGHAAGEAAGRQQIYVGLPFLMLIDIELFLKSPNSHKYFQKE